MYKQDIDRRLPTLAAFFIGSALLTGSALAQTFTVTVPGNSGRHWVNTGRYLSPNTRVDQRASGVVTLGGGRGIFGPEGTSSFARGDGYPADTPRRYGLVARLTASTTNTEDELRDVDRDYGSSPSFCAVQGGNLWLTVNDNSAVDNTGALTVDISLSACGIDPPPPPPPTTARGDLRVTGMEVTQATQVYPGNLIPLIGYKKTVVRVYLQSDDGSGGPWTDVTARLTVHNISGTHAGSAIVDRFLLPSTRDSRSVITASPGGSHRDRWDDSLNFVLDLDQTAPGEREFTVDISSLSGRRESDTTNNHLMQRATFGAPRYVSMYGTGYGLTNSGPACSAPLNPPTPAEGSIIPFTAFEAHRRYAESVYPVTNFFVSPLPGGSAGTLFDNGDCLAHERAHAALARQIDHMYPHGSARAYLLTPTYAPGYFGWCCNGSNGNLIARGNDFSFDPGPTVAHEIAHSFGRAHTFEDAMYPYPDNSIGSNTGLRSNLGFYGFGVDTVSARNGDGTPANFDVMSYTPGFWISPYTYCGLLDAISGGASRCSSGAIRGTFALPANESMHAVQQRPGLLAPAGERTSFVYVAGGVDPNGRAALEPFEIVRSSEDLTSASGKGAYTLRLEGNDGATIGQYSFGRNPYYPDEPFRFSAYLPFSQQITRVVLANGKTVLATRKVSPNAPEIAMTLYPPHDRKVEGRQKIAWKASDADGDALVFSVDYSADGGTTWLAVDNGLSGNSATIDFDSLPGSDKALLRVSATDGFNTAESMSEAFAVPRKSPAITLYPSNELTLQQGQTLTVEAMAFDWEDGPISDVSSYVWMSDVDGALGVGPWIRLGKLSAGKHRVTVSVSDSDKNVSTATVLVTVLSSK